MDSELLIVEMGDFFVRTFSSGCFVKLHPQFYRQFVSSFSMADMFLLFLFGRYHLYFISL